MLRFCSLGSGSAGNGLIVEASCGLFPTRVLVDNGFGPRQLARRLQRTGLGIDDLDAIVLTHEHSDHTNGVAALIRQRRIPVFATARTLTAANLTVAAVGDASLLRPIRPGVALMVGDLGIAPFSVPHDAADPVQFVFSDGARRLGLLTDIGMPTAAVGAALAQVDALMLESNHDRRMLETGPYPEFLKDRIGGDRGHLSNDQAAELLVGLDRSRLHRIVLAHLSRTNNRPELARRAVAGAVGCSAIDIVVADQEDGCGWFTA